MKYLGVIPVNKVNQIHNDAGESRINSTQDEVSETLISEIKQQSNVCYFW